MIKTSIEIGNLKDIDKRKVELPPDLHYFALTIAYLVNDFADKHNIMVEEVIKNINEDTEIVKKYK